MADDSLKLKLPKEYLEMDSREARNLLSRFAEQIWLDDPSKEWSSLEPLLKEPVGYGTIGISEQEFRSLKPHNDRLFLGYSGPCNLEDKSILEKQKASLSGITSQIGYLVDGNVHGATMWSYIPEVHLSAIKGRRLSIGIMPKKGLWDLHSVSEDFPKDFPKMHYLGIVGEDYSDPAYYNTFGSMCDGVLLLGGREGAYLESSAAINQKKFVLCHDIEGDSRAIARMQGGKIVLPSIGDVAEFIKNNLTPDQRRFTGEQMEFEDFDKYLLENDVINIGFVSTSGAFTNYPYFRKVLSSLLSRAIPNIKNRVELTSGGTKYGGVWEIYDVAKEMGIRTNGVMSGKGLKNPWVNVDRMVYVGDEWGKESPNFLYSANILLAFSGGPQAKNEIKTAAESGGRYHWKGGIPVIAVYDEKVKGATYDLHEEGFNHQNLHYFHTSEIPKAANCLRDAITGTYSAKKYYSTERF